MYPGAVEHLLPLPQHQGGALVVDVLQDGGDLRVELPQLFHKVLFGGEHGGARHQHHHHLAGGKAPLYQHVAQKAPARVLVIGLELEVLQQPPDGDDDPVGGFVLGLAGVDGHDLVGAGLVHPADDPPPALVVGKGRLHLVAVVVGRLHPQYGGDFPKLAQQLLAAVLFPDKLAGIA